MNSKRTLTPAGYSVLLSIWSGGKIIGPIKGKYRIVGTETIVRETTLFRLIKGGYLITRMQLKSSGISTYVMSPTGERKMNEIKTGMEAGNYDTI